MTSGPTYKVPFKRKKSHKTDYTKRLALLKSKDFRFIVRLSNNLVKMQIVDYSINGDKTLVSTTSKELTKLGWNYSLKNTSAIYLTSLLLCSKAKSKNIKKVIFDLGLKNYKAKSKIFAALKGIVDFGLECPYNEKAFPIDERICGKVSSEFLKNNMNKDFENIKEKILKM
jgi:large subunit ribosomal protein L18